MSGGIWIFGEQREGSLSKTTLELLTMGRDLANKLQEDCSLVLFGHHMNGLAEKVSSFGLDTVYLADRAVFAQYTTEAFSSVLTDLVKNNDPRAVFWGNTAMGRDLAPRVAERIGAGLVSDCTGVEIKNNQLIFTKPIYAGKAFCQVVTTGKVAMATFRANSFSTNFDTGYKMPNIVQVETNLPSDSLRVFVKDIVMKAAGKVPLSEAEIIVSGGRGMKGPENFKLLEDLAQVLGAAVGASRAAVDAGWREHSDQVGQTGKTVSPKLYIACGISGAIQHLAGMGTSKTIVAINKDPEANIFKVADYGIVDDLFKAVPVLTEEFKKVLK
ncbi:electron transfer flavoprotein subunit alpha/FixB family protein [Candidatus Formimonas warabiya]|uniref:Electron transfer flavoprotein subunit alpha n=1 Tax=Formimonas warabiya TaxID=1761012 RepID=A0A3G1KZU2_FORW1|nr:electron transfer flavoprotein subunit alpha/FixB family protein [Candidatus Formimonas warabiya]ATW28056.1 electron transfer flavoprotein subunit alpha [Candidatus Formimonas warabiya]